MLFWKRKNVEPEKLYYPSWVREHETAKLREDAVSAEGANWQGWLYKQMQSFMGSYCKDEPNADAGRREFGTIVAEIAELLPARHLPQDVVIKERGHESEQQGVFLEGMRRLAAAEIVCHHKLSKQFHFKDFVFQSGYHGLNKAYQLHGFNRSTAEQHTREDLKKIREEAPGVLARLHMERGMQRWQEEETTKRWAEETREKPEASGHDAREGRVPFGYGRS